MEGNRANIAALMDGFEKTCKAKGLRVTHQRIEIFKALLNPPGHPTTESVYHNVRQHLNTISLDTVYRTLSTFEEFGLIKRVPHIDNATRFDINVTNHHHLVCSRCHKIEDFHWPEFDRMTPPQSVAHWAECEEKQVVISGLCSSCKENDNDR